MQHDEVIWQVSEGHACLVRRRHTTCMGPHI